MSIKVLIDMNLSPRWVEVFKGHDVLAVHWSDVGNHKASDSVIMDWAKKNGHIVFTHDLDFGTLLAVTHATAPSVLQVRTQNVLPENLGPFVITALKRYQSELQKGALIILDETTYRVRILPLIQ